MPACTMWRLQGSTRLIAERQKPVTPFAKVWVSIHFVFLYLASGLASVVVEGHCQ